MKNKIALLSQDAVFTQVFKGKQFSEQYELFVPDNFLSFKQSISSERFELAIVDFESGDWAKHIKFMSKQLPELTLLYFVPAGMVMDTKWYAFPMTIYSFVKTYKKSAIHKAIGSVLKPLPKSTQDATAANHMDAIFSTSNRGMALLGADLQCLKVNEKLCEILRCTEQEAIAHNLFQLLSPAVSEQLVAEICTKVQMKEIVQQVEIGLLLSGEQELWVALTAHYFEDSEVRGSDTFITIRDISREKFLENNYRIIVETANDGIWSIDKDRKTVFMNKHMAELLRCPIEEVRSHNLDEFIFPEDMQAHEMEMKIRKAGTASKYERRFRRMDGTELWTIVSATPMFDNSGSFAGSFGMFTDISIQKKLENELREKEELYRLLFDKANDMVFVYTFSDDGRREKMLEMNETARTVLGYQKDDFTQSNLPNIIPEIYTDKFSWDVRNRNSFPLEETVFITKDGIKLHVEIHTHIFMHHGIRTAISIVRDISERVRAEQNLRKSEERLRGYIANAPNSIILFDENLQLIEGNLSASNISGYSPDELVGKSIIPLIRGITPEEFLTARKELLEVGRISREIMMLRKDGSEIDISIDVVKVNNDPVQFLGFLKDITNIKQTERELTTLSGKLAALLQNLDAGILMEDSEQRITYVNQEFINMFNIPLSTHQLMGYSGVILAEKGKDFFVNPELFLAGKQEHAWRKQKSETEELILKDGRVLEWNYSPVIERDVFSGHLWIYRDITARKLAEELLKKEQFKFETFANYTSDWEYWVLPDGTLEYMSPSCKSITGYSAHEFLENPDLLIDIVHNDDLQKMKNHLREARTNETAGEQDQFEFRIVTKIGLVKDILHICRNVFSKDGLFLGRRISNKDVTDRRIASDYLRHSEAFMKSIYDGTRLPILVVDVEGKDQLLLSGYNKAFSSLVHRVNDTMIATDVRQFWQCTDFTDDSVDLLSEVLLLALTDFDLPEFEMQSCKHSITSFWQTKVSSLERKNGEVYRLVVSFLNITERKSAEQEVLETKNRFETIFQMSPHAISITRCADSKYANVNNAFSALTGFSHEEAISKTSLDLGLWRIPDERPDLIQKLQQSNLPVQIEAEFVRKDKVEIVCQVTAQFIELAGEKHILSIIHDVTEERKMRKALIESELKFRSYIEHAPVGIYICNEELQFLELNNKAAELLSCTIDEGKQLFIYDILLPESQELAEQVLREILQGEIITRDFMIHNVSGEKIWVEVTSMRLTAGKIMGFVSDINDRKLAAEALLEREERFSSFMENLYGLAFIKDEDGKITFVNHKAAALFETVAEEWIGKRISELSFINEGLRNRLLEADEKVSLTNAPNGFDYNFTLQAEEMHWKFTVFPIGQGLKRTIAVMGFDISAEHKLQWALDSVVKLNNEFDSLSSHQLMQQCLDATIQITDSKIGFIHFVDEELEVVYKQLWSDEEFSKKLDYSISSSPIWNAVFTNRKAVIYNLCPASDAPCFPNRSCPFDKLLATPIFSDGKLVAILGVGNKSVHYVDLDITLLELITNNAWKILARKKVESNLRESESRFRHVLENSALAGISINAKGELLYCNEFMLKTSGYGLEELQGLQWLEKITAPDARAGARAMVENAFIHNQVESKSEGVFLTKDQEIKYFAWTNTLHLDENGKAVMLSSIGVDITEQKVSRDSLALSLEITHCFHDVMDIGIATERVLQLLMSFSGMECGGVYLFSHDQNELQLHAHSGLSERFIESVSRVENEDSRYKVAKRLSGITNILRLTDFKESVPFEDEGIKVLFVLPLRFQDQNIGIVNLASKNKKLMNPLVLKELPSLSSQITTHLLKLKTEISLKESEERYRMLLESAPAAIVLVKDGKYLFANKTTLQYLGAQSETDIIEKDFYQDISELGRNYVYERIQATMKNRSEASFELPMMQTDGTEIYLQAVAFPLSVPDESTVLIIGTDITDRKHAEVQALNSLREKETLLKEIHHRVKNNLQIISSLLNLQSEYLQGEDTKRAFVESLSRIRSMALIHERLYQTKDFSRIEIADYISDLTHYLIRTFNDERKPIHLDLDLDEIFLNLDTAMPIGLIINELVSNAFKYAYKEMSEGELVIACKQTGPGKLLLKVSDNGKGIPAELNFKDTVSLGFQLVCSLVEQLHGTIELENRPGTCFTIHCSVL